LFCLGLERRLYAFFQQPQRFSFVLSFGALPKERTALFNKEICVTEWHTATAS
jgi:hypothetical protein